MIENLRTRLQYRGGEKQQDRLTKDKLRSLEKAIDTSYQSEIVDLNGKQFRCLINHNKISLETNDKLFSIPFEAEEVASGGVEETGIKVGSVVHWLRPDSHWLVFLQYETERAYFKGLMKECEDQIEIAGETYWCSLKGPDEAEIGWNKGPHYMYNDFNYSMKMYITADENTRQLERFSIIKIGGQPWEVQSVDRISHKGILTVYLKETFSNDLEAVQGDPVAPSTNKIVGPIEVYPYERYTYSTSLTNGIWIISEFAKIISTTDSTVEIEVTRGRTGTFNITYQAAEETATLDITILSL